VNLIPQIGVYVVLVPDGHSPAFGGEDLVSNMSNGELGSA
jgi:hypothetical protein